MTKSQSHMLQKRPNRSYSSEEMATPLLRWLNEARREDRKSHDAVASFLADVIWVTEFGGHMREAIRDTKKRKTLNEEDVQHFDDLGSKIHRTLYQHPARREAIFDSEEGGWRTTWRPLTAKGYSISFPMALDGAGIFSGRVYSESSAILDIVELMNTGDIRRVRQCLQCGAWQFARFKHQQFCSAACQQAHFRGSSDFKKRRASYMKDYRKLQQTRNVK